MKELEKHDRDIEKQSIELQQVRQQEVEFTYDSTLRPKRGHKLFEINKKTLEVSEASFKEEKYISWHQAVEEMETGIVKREVVKKKDHVYISALNAATALKRYKEGRGSATRPEGWNLDL